MDVILTSFIEEGEEVWCLANSKNQLVQEGSTRGNVKFGDRAEAITALSMRSMMLTLAKDLGLNVTNK